MLIRTTLTVAGLLVLAVAASAQNPGPGRGVGALDPRPPMLPRRAARDSWGRGGHDGQVVKNAPYSPIW